MKPTEQKTMLDFLNEVSIEKGYRNWYEVYSSDHYSECNRIPQEAGRRFAQWAISQMQPEWVPCKYGDYIPNGHYVFKLNNNGIESTKSMYVDEEQVDYYFATGYIHIELPPKDIKS